MSQKIISSLVFCTLASLVMGLAPASGAVTPMTSAKVTRIENKATIGTIKNGQITDERPAVVSDVITTSSIFQTTSSGRAELEFANKSLVRLGPNSVFSFDSSSRTVSLEKGNMLFYLPPGQGGVKIKTAAATAAITGTVVAVTETGIVVLEGTFTLTYVDANGVTQRLELNANNPASKSANFDSLTGRWSIDPNFDFQDFSALAQTATSLVSFAVLPEGAEIAIGANSPSLADAIARNSFAQQLGRELDLTNPNGTPASTVFGNVNSGGAGAGVFTTEVLSGGGIGLFQLIDGVRTLVRVLQ